MKSNTNILVPAFNALVSRTTEAMVNSVEEVADSLRAVYSGTFHAQTELPKIHSDDVSSLLNRSMKVTIRMKYNYGTDSAVYPLGKTSHTTELPSLERFKAINVAFMASIAALKAMEPVDSERSLSDQSLDAEGSLSDQTSPYYSGERSRSEETSDETLDHRHYNRLA